MRIPTSVNIVNTPATQGSVTIREGELIGKQNRTVILEATPATGYVFDRWEIETTPVQLKEFARVGTRYTSADEVCSAEQVNLTTPVYTDGTMLYTDSQGKFVLADGFWQSNRGTYYAYTGNSIPSLQTCTQVVQQTENTGTIGGVGGGGGGGTGIAPNRGFGIETTFEDNTRNFI